MTRKGVPLVVSAPSGAGKTTLCRRVMAELPGTAFSISHTTRPPRPKETNGVDYHFVDDKRFEEMVANKEFLEWANVHDRKYGTALKTVSAQMDSGTDVFFDIDIQGGRQIQEQLPQTALVFVLPPSMSELEVRLRGRKSDSEEQVQRRLQAARNEIEAASFYRYWIVNDDLERAVSELRSIVMAERVAARDYTTMIRAVMA